MYDAVHVQVQVVELHLVGVRFGGVHGDPDPVAFFALKKRKIDDEEGEDISRRNHREFESHS